jgi:predicted dienelactone hydrolase
MHDFGPDPRVSNPSFGIDNVRVEVLTDRAISAGVRQVVIDSQDHPNVGQAMKRLSTVIAMFFATAWCVSDVCLFAEEYDPLRTAQAARLSMEDLTIQDDSRRREIPIRIYLPETKEPAPVILFSHGLGGSRRGCSYLGKHWSARGYIAVFMQHRGSDESVWKDVPIRKRLAAMKDAASLQNTLARFRDVPAVLDELGKWNDDTDHPLAGRFDLEKIGLSGHSYGARTTQAVGGQSFGRIGQRFTDNRIKASLVLSPSTPRRGDPKQAFADVKIPWMLMTGTKDDSPIDETVTPESRMAVFPALPNSIDKYELVLHEGQHSAFSDGPERRGRAPRNPNHHPAILALSTAFWDAHLRKDADARRWLQGPKARSVLQDKDRWQVNSPSDH